MTLSLLSCWERTVRAAPAATALIQPTTEKITTREDLDAAGSAWCRAHGAGLADRMVVMAESNGPEWFRVFLGLVKAGAVVVPLDPGEPPAAQQVAAARIGAGWLWSGGALQSVGARSRSVRDERRIVKLTSGSTGVPRALAFTDGQMLADGRQVCAGMDIRPDDTNFGLIPFGHSYGLGNLVLPLLAQGTAIVCGTAALPHVMAATIARWRPSVFPAVPALLRALAGSDLAPGQLESLRTVISAGAPLAAETAAAFFSKFGRKVHSFYGSSETGGITYDRGGDAALTGRSVGAPLPGVRIEWGRGRRFAVASAAVFTLGNRRRTEDGLGLYCPADRAALTPEGELVLLGRAGRFVKIAGRRLNLAEVERTLRELPGVRDALVVPHSARADALSAAVATDHTAETVRAALHVRLAAWKVPKKILTLATFPLTLRGKTDVRRLREQLAG